MSKHTPGPWPIRHYKFQGIERVIRIEIGTRRSLSPVYPAVAQIASNFDETAEANALLIAAAPELLEALQNIKSNLTGSDCPAERWASSLKYATQAIAKVEGGGE